MPSFVTSPSYERSGYTVVWMWNDGRFEVFFDYIEKCDSKEDAIQSVRRQSPHFGSVHNLESRRAIVVCVVPGYHPEMYTKDSLGDVDSRSTLFKCSCCELETTEYIPYSCTGEINRAGSFERVCSRCLDRKAGF